jgi:hypothetical protein
LLESALGKFSSCPTSKDKPDALLQLAQLCTSMQKQIEMRYGALLPKFQSPPPPPPKSTYSASSSLSALEQDLNLKLPLPSSESFRYHLSAEAGGADELPSSFMHLSPPQLNFDETQFQQSENKRMRNHRTNSSSSLVEIQKFLSGFSKSSGGNSGFFDKLDKAFLDDVEETTKVLNSFQLSSSLDLKVKVFKELEQDHQHANVLKQMVLQLKQVEDEMISLYKSVDANNDGLVTWVEILQTKHERLQSIVPAPLPSTILSLQDFLALVLKPPVDRVLNFTF